MKNSVLRVVATRGEHTESEHLVDAMVMNSKAVPQLQWGDCQRAFYPRSAIKMLQASLLLSPRVGLKMKISPEQLALACASHHGEPQHTEVVESWLSELNLDESILVCGAHEPVHKKTLIQMYRTGAEPRKIHNNCSGKHCGLLTVALSLGADPRSYFEFGHPVQRMIREVMSEASGVDFHMQIPWAIDGCGIPTYWAGLEIWMRAMTRVLAPENKLILDAVTAHPVMISGTEGLCSQVIQRTSGRVLFKAGAEGVYLALIPSQKMGVMVKARDGSMRAAKAAILWILNTELGVFSGSEFEQIQPWSEMILKNWAGAQIGDIKVHADF